MFKLAVLGPIVTEGFGVARQCLKCYRFKAPGGELPCFGFGAGCLGYRPQPGERVEGPRQSRDGDR
ncbi:MAG: hypothetical protein A3I02_15965 [Betaproteobacteria bacterium RIFCSPLOWO2_02_FULL_67_26]|nr:MAG: hypothetical protein A3I02_15965 [Betaproteobacteria bacterium RIFCSPLOWO2_02_FULL_67_26]